MMEKLKHLLKVFDLRKFIKFGLIGVLNTLVDFAVFFVANKLIGDGPSVVLFGMVLVLGPYISNTISYIVANIHSFIWNKFWTFEKKGRLTRREVLRYLVTSAGYLIVSSAGLAAFIAILHVLPMTAALPEDTVRLLAKVPTAGITIFYNYLMNKFWVFK